MRCKFVVSTPDSVDITQLRSEADALFGSLNLSGKIIDKNKGEL